MTIGHNTQNERLKQFITRIEKLNEEKAALTADIREVYSEAKSAGFDVKVMRDVVKIRKQDKADREERQSLIDVYLAAVGEYASTPLGQAALPRNK
jgi:uncharacterized protein (UPF0335 family)